MEQWAGSKIGEHKNEIVGFTTLLLVFYKIVASQVA